MGARPDVQGRAVVRADAVVIEMQKANYIGAPQVFTLELACKQINEAFGGFGCFLVGSSIQRADWRDVDIRLILPDDQFRNLFPDSEINYELDCRWLILSSSLSMFLSKVSGLPVDFQIQPQTKANLQHTGQRHAIGLSNSVNEKE